MHLKFSHRGRQFFFLTFVIKGRRPVLSRVVAVEKNGREEAEVEMTSLGEVVIEAWKAQHGQNAALTASARVIMPDHVHLLLIVNYDIDSHFDILDWLHHFRRAIEAKWVALAGRGAGAQPPSVVEWEDPSAEDSRELAAHRLLILSGFPQSVRDDRAAFRRNCLAMNDLAAAICTRALLSE